MKTENDLWLIDELSVEEPAELLRTMPEIRQWVDTSPSADHDVGLRAVLERPEALWKAWWRSAGPSGGRSSNRRRGRARDLKKRAPRHLSPDDVQHAA